MTKLSQDNMLPPCICVATIGKDACKCGAYVIRSPRPLRLSCFSGSWSVSLTTKIVRRRAGRPRRPGPIRRRLRLCGIDLRCQGRLRAGLLLGAQRRRQRARRRRGLRT